MKAFAAAALVSVVVAFVAGGLVFSQVRRARVVRVVDPRPLILDNRSTPTEVVANFGGKPAHVEVDGGGITCRYYGSTQATLNGVGPAWVIRLCVRGISS